MCMCMSSISHRRKHGTSTWSQDMNGSSHGWAGSAHGECCVWSLASLLACSCDVNGSNSTECDVTTGQCPCKENVMGRTCDHCQVIHTWTLTTVLSFDCILCLSSINETINILWYFLSRGSSACTVARVARPVAAATWDLSHRHVMLKGDASVWRVWLGTSVTDAIMVTIVSMAMAAQVDQLKCNFMADASLAYPVLMGHVLPACNCNHTGGNCDPESGACICPPHTDGDTCDRCQTGHWGHDLLTGCKVQITNYTNRSTYTKNKCWASFLYMFFVVAYVKWYFTVHVCMTSSTCYI